jgi:hypothetical protein
MDNNLALALLTLYKVKKNNDENFLYLMKRVRDGRVEKKKKRTRKGNKENFKHLGDEALQRDYFREDPVEDEKTFRRRFRMSRDLYAKIKANIIKADPWFEQTRDAAHKLGYSTDQKITAALRMLAYAVPGDFVTEYLRVKEATALESMKRFCKAVIEIYKEEYLRKPNKDDIARLYKVGEERGFPGMLGSLDCMHWEWKNCPTAHHGQNKGKNHRATVVLEAVASKDLWIWHAFFGTPGSLNDLNVLARSPLFDQLVSGDAPSSAFTVNGNRYEMGYYLVDGIYPTYSTFVKTISLPQTRRQQVYEIYLYTHILSKYIFILDFC